MRQNGGEINTRLLPPWVLIVPCWSFETKRDLVSRTNRIVQNREKEKKRWIQN